MLYTRNQFSHVIAAEKSMYSWSSLLMCQKNNSADIALAKVHFFAKYNADGEKHTLSCAAVSWYMPHPCHVWFGQPTQVWTVTSSPGYSFIPLPNMLCTLSKP